MSPDLVQLPQFLESANSKSLVCLAGWPAGQNTRLANVCRELHPSTRLTFAKSHNTTANRLAAAETSSVT